MQKWEYLVWIGGNTTEGQLRFYDTSTGYREEKVKEGAEYAKRLAELGEKGWELVCCRDYSLYFKRPKP